MKHRIASTLAVALLAGLGFASARTAGLQETGGKQETEEKSQEAGQGQEAKKVIVPFYGNAACPLTGRPVQESAFLKHGDQHAYFCCKNCLGKAKDDPAKAVAAAYPADKVKKWENKTCPMSGRTIDPEKGETAVFQGHEVAFCCGNCAGKFGKQSTSVLTRLTYPKAKWVKNRECPVMDGEPTDGEVLALYADHVVQFCCEDCIQDFIADPETGLAAAKKSGG